MANLNIVGQQIVSLESGKSTLLSETSVTLK